MIEAKYSFPQGFLWGTATAAYQVEGSNKNTNWYRWEQEGHITTGDQCGLACDWWSGRWREDFDRATDTYQNSHRLSIEWSRIQPTPDKWDDDALDFYRNMLKGLIERGMTPMVTLHHFTDPLWLSDLGGWENQEAIKYFTQFTERVVEALKEYVNLWCTINEPNVYTVMGYLMGIFPPGKSDPAKAYTVIQNMLRGHASAYQTIHKIQPDAKVGMAINYRSFMPARKWFAPDRWIARFQSKNYNDLFVSPTTTGFLKYILAKKRVPEAKGTLDFIGINYYTRDYVKFSLLKVKDFFAHRYYRDGVELSETGFIANEPDGFYEAIKWALSYKLPIYITENGIDDSKDVTRPSYLIKHLVKLWRAINFNFPIKGYFHWSLVDNFEWERGWSQRFGLWDLDINSQARKKRRSADLYAEVCHENSLTSEIVNKYAPQIFDEIFPK